MWRGGPSGPTALFQHPVHRLARTGLSCAGVFGPAFGKGAVAMTATKEAQTISEALALIDRGLADVQRRNLITSDEVSNLLLDVRLLLSTLEHDALN